MGLGCWPGRDGGGRAARQASTRPLPPRRASRRPQAHAPSFFRASGAQAAGCRLAALSRDFVGQRAHPWPPPRPKVGDVTCTCRWKGGGRQPTRSPRPHPQAAAPTIFPRIGPQASAAHSRHLAWKARKELGACACDGAAVGARRGLGGRSGRRRPGLAAAQPHGHGAAQQYPFHNGRGTSAPLAACFDRKSTVRVSPAQSRCKRSHHRLLESETPWPATTHNSGSG
eukprot:COSAG04_NODE_59_length_30260_cov_18.181327_17_plen_227_part_00